MDKRFFMRLLEMYFPSDTEEALTTGGGGEQHGRLHVK